MVLFIARMSCVVVNSYLGIMCKRKSDFFSGETSEI
jgi:hypothetical protein